MGFAGYLVKPVREASLVRAAESASRPRAGWRSRRAERAVPRMPPPHRAADLPRPSENAAARAAAPPAKPRSRDEASKFFWPRTIRSTRF